MFGTASSVSSGCEDGSDYQNPSCQLRSEDAGDAQDRGVRQPLRANPPEA